MNNCPVCDNPFDKEVCSQFFNLFNGIQDIHYKLINQPIKDELLHISWTSNNMIYGISYFTNYPEIKEIRLICSRNELKIWKNFQTGFYNMFCSFNNESSIELFYNCKTFDEVETKLNKLIIFQNESRTNKII